MRVQRGVIFVSYSPRCLCMCVGLAPKNYRWSFFSNSRPKNGHRGLPRWVVRDAGWRAGRALARALLFYPQARACAATGAQRRRQIGPPSRITATTTSAAAAAVAAAAVFVQLALR